jgi:hypothetical protein
MDTFLKIVNLTNYQALYKVNQELKMYNKFKIKIVTMKMNRICKPNHKIQIKNIFQMDTILVKE